MTGFGHEDLVASDHTILSDAEALGTHVMGVLRLLDSMRAVVARAGPGALREDLRAGLTLIDDAVTALRDAAR